MQWQTRRVIQSTLLLSAATVTFIALSRGDTSTVVSDDAAKMLAEGRNTFRFDTFGDEAFWGDTIQLHKGVATVSPATALAVGLKVDAEALPSSLVDQVKAGKVDLNSPATTLALLKLNAVIGVTGFFNSDGTLKSIGIQCALCHSTVDNSF